MNCVAFSSSTLLRPLHRDNIYVGQRGIQTKLYTTQNIKLNRKISGYAQSEDSILGENDIELPIEEDEEQQIRYDGPITNSAIAKAQRKRAIVTVKVAPGNGKFTIDGRPLEEFYNVRFKKYIRIRAIWMARLPLTKIWGEDVVPPVDVEVRCRPNVTRASMKLSGGGPIGKAWAIRLGLSRALAKSDPIKKPFLYKLGFLYGDRRQKERVKYGLRKARRAVQFSKR